MSSMQKMTKDALKATGEFEKRYADGNSVKLILAFRKINAVCSKWLIKKRIIEGGNLGEYDGNMMGKLSKLAAKLAHAMDPELEDIARHKYIQG
jgi:hypothetical protein